MFMNLASARPCRRCGVSKATTEFNLSTRSGHQYWCRSCQKAWYREHRAQHIANVSVNSRRYLERHRAFVSEYLLTHPCVDCGETNRMVLEFDHVRDKIDEVSRLVGSPVRRLTAEIQKCEVRCANCHMRRTADQLGWRKARETSVANVLEVRV
jgi:hypothetical protein